CGRRRFRGGFGADAAGGDVEEASSVQRRGVEAFRFALEDDVHGVIGVGGDADLAGEVVRGAERDDAEGDVVAVESIDDFVDGAVAAGGRDDVDAAASGVGGEGGRFAGLEGDE